MSSVFVGSHYGLATIAIVRGHRREVAGASVKYIVGAVDIDPSSAPAVDAAVRFDGASSDEAHPLSGYAS